MALYDDIGNRKNVHSGAGARPLWYTGNALNQYVNWGSDSFIPIAGKASADAKVTVKATASGVSRTYEPVRDGEDFAIDIPVDVSRGAVVTDLEVNAVRFDEQQDVDLYRRLSGRYTVTPNAANVMAYDADGNLLAYDGWTLTWNGENRLVQIEKGSHRETYDYDYMGRRFVKKVYSKENDVWSLAGEEVFVYDGYRQIAAYAGASRTLVRTYAWDAAGLDTPLWTTDATGSCFYVADANKNIRMLFDGNGTAVAEYDYAPFGQVTATGDYAAVNPYRFSSEFHDDGTGLVYYNYRYYSPVLGRWTSRDPIGEEGGGNLYVLVYNNPVHHIDVFGLFQWPHRGYCAGKSYNRFTSCCCCNGEKVRNGGSECKKQDCNDYRDTGIKQCFILPIINSSKYGHAYITIDGKSWGFWPGKNPFGGIGLIGRDPYEGKGICIPVVISPCSHNREKFRSSVRNFIENARKNQNLRYFYPIYACNWFVKKAIEAGIYGSEGCTSGD